MPSTTIKYFKYDHLPEGPGKEVSQACAEFALGMERILFDSAEKSAGMRKLLEAKDCFVRAALDGANLPEGPQSLLAWIVTDFIEAGAVKSQRYFQAREVDAPIPAGKVVKVTFEFVDEAETIPNV